jgi:dTDP-glucose 4,6-dehydratase
MNILVTGGLGAIGGVLVEELRQRGHGVWLCDLPHHYDPQYIRCDVAEYRQLERIFDHHHFDIVYHLAAEYGRWNGEDFYETLWRSNMIGTKNVIRLQEKHRFRHVFFSTSEVYGDWDGVMREDVMDHNEVRQLNDYAITKWAGELQVMNSAQMTGTESVRVRLFNVYGPGEKYSNYRSVNCLFCYRALHNLPYTVYLQHHRCATYVSDAVRTLANIAEKFVPGEVYNVGSTEYQDIKTVSDLVLRYLGKDDCLVTYQRLEPFTTRDKKVDVTKAERDLGHCPRVPLAEGLAWTLEWMRKHYAPPEKLAVPLTASTAAHGAVTVHLSAKHSSCRSSRQSTRPLLSQRVLP